jgi:hypothetical protein
LPICRIRKHSKGRRQSPTSSFRFVLSLVCQCAIEVALEYKVPNFLLVVALQKLARAMNWR